MKEWYGSLNLDKSIYLSIYLLSENLFENGCIYIYIFIYLYVYEAFQRIEATCNKALKTSDMAISKRGQTTPSRCRILAAGKHAPNPPDTTYITILADIFSHWGAHVSGEYLFKKQVTVIVTYTTKNDSVNYSCILWQIGLQKQATSRDSYPPPPVSQEPGKDRNGMYECMTLFLLLKSHFWIHDTLRKFSRSGLDVQRPHETFSSSSLLSFW